MKKVFLGLIAIATLTIAHAQTSSNEIKPAATAEVKDITKSFSFTNAEYDFGKTPHNKAIEFNVEIKNVSTDSATIDNVTVGCGCTTPKFERGKKFAPGETITVTIAFNGSALGGYQRNATIFLNNGAFSKQVIFKGETYEVPTGAPANGSLGTLKP
jgi:hypothetical protein